MKKLILLLFLVGHVFNLANASTSSPVNTTASYGDGWLDEVNGLPLLHLKGSDHEMGKQYGFLAGDKIHATVEYLKEIARRSSPDVQFIPDWAFLSLRRVVGWVFWQTFPDSFRTHIKGIVEGAKARQPAVKLNKYDIAFMNSLIDLTGILHEGLDGIDPRPLKQIGTQKFLDLLGLGWLKTNCDSFAAWGPRTVGGKTFQTRNIDVPTGQGLERFPLVIITKPDNGIPYVSAAYAGMAGVFTGMNAYGVGLGQIWAFSNKTEINSPWQVKLREVFANARSAREAVLLLSETGNMAYGNNFVFADAGAGSNGYASEGFAVEASPKRFSVFEANDPREKEALWNGEPYGIPLPYAVFRGDVALDSDVRSEQNASNGPDGDPRTASAYKLRYKGQSDRILAYEQEGVKIGKNEAEVISRETAIRGASLQTAVYANTDREMWVSYAKILPDGSIQQAYDGVYAHIPFNRYLPTLEWSGDEGTVLVRTWMGNSTRVDFSAVVRRGQAILAVKPLTIRKSVQQSVQESVLRVKFDGITLNSRDVIEIYPALDVGVLLIDRLTVK